MRPLLFIALVVLVAAAARAAGRRDSPPRDMDECAVSECSPEGVPLSRYAG